MVKYVEKGFEYRGWTLGEDVILRNGGDLFQLNTMAVGICGSNNSDEKYILIGSEEGHSIEFLTNSGLGCIILENYKEEAESGKLLVVTVPEKDYNKLENGVKVVYITRENLKKFKAKKVVKKQKFECKREALRVAALVIKERLGAKGVYGKINSIDDGISVIKKVMIEKINIDSVKEKEELYNRISELSTQNKSLELENGKYKRKKEKYSKEFEDLKQQNSINVKSLVIKDKEMEELKAKVMELLNKERELNSEIIKLKDCSKELEKEKERLERKAVYLEKEVTGKNNINEILMDENDNLRGRQTELHNMTFIQRMKWLIKGE